jgi:hypothetical protein
VDLNGDGHEDILSGSYSRLQQEMAGLFQVLWGQADGEFKPAATLTGTDDQPLIIPIEEQKYQTENICTRPTAIDWDGDGDLDLVVGNFAGSFYVFKGEGSGRFHPQPDLLKTDDNQPLKISGVHSDPFVIDWDGDGDLDLLSGSSNGGVQWAENQALEGFKRPVFKSFQPLIPATQQQVAGSSSLRQEDLKGPTTSTRIWVDDLNGDGKLDVLVGDSVTLSRPAEGLSEAESKQRQAEWEKELAESLKKLQDGQATEEERAAASVTYSQLYQKRSEFVHEERTGFVWLYLQK